jgi:hypothetical protein
VTTIVLLSLAADHGRASKVLSALVGERLDARWFSVTPDDRDWDAAVAGVHAARSVLICWSDATRAEAAAPFRTLARYVAEAGTAVGIELDRGAAPLDLPMTVYSLNGWRMGQGLWRWIIGRIFYNDIVSAAKFKAAGRDPAPPSATTKLLIRQLWVGVVGIGALLGLLALPGKIYNSIPWPRFNEERAWNALPKDSCVAVVQFRRDYPDGRHAGTVKTILENRVRATPVWTARDRSAPFFAAAGSAAPKPSEALARADALTRARAEADKVCAGFTEAAESRLMAVALRAEQWECSASGGGTVCSVAGTATCRVQELVESNEEYCPIPGR